MPCSSDGYALYSWDDFKPFIEAYNAMIESDQIMRLHRDDLIEYYASFMQGFSRQLIAVACFGEKLPLQQYMWKLGVSGYHNWDPRKNFETIICKIGSKIQLPEGARPAYKYHLDRDMKRYKDALNELIGILNSNARDIRALGGTTSEDFKSLVNSVNELRYKIQDSELTSVADTREAILNLFDQNRVIQLPAYSKIRSKF